MLDVSVGVEMGLVTTRSAVQPTSAAAAPSTQKFFANLCDSLNANVMNYSFRVP